jgi:hypothetical protein
MPRAGYRSDGLQSESIAARRLRAGNVRARPVGGVDVSPVPLVRVACPRAAEAPRGHDQAPELGIDLRSRRQTRELVIMADTDIGPSVGNT